MKKSFKKILCFMVLMLIPILSVRGESNDNFVTSGSVSKNQVNHSVFVANNTVNYQDDVKGIAFVAGNSVDVDSVVDYGFYAANDLKVNGTINNDLFVAGNTITIDQDTIIGRDAYVAGNIINFNSNMEGNLFIAGNSITLNNVTINGDVNLSGETVKIVGNVNILGTLKYNDNCNIENIDSLKASNKETYKSEDIKNNAKNIFSETLTSIAMVIVLGFVLVLLFKNLYNKVVNEINAKDIFMNILWGLVGLIVIPIMAIILLCTVVGVELGVVAILVYIIALLIAMVFASMCVGNLLLTKLFKAKDNAYLSITIGVIVLKLLELIPYVGGFIGLMAFLYGLGESFTLFKNREK